MRASIRHAERDLPPVSACTAASPPAYLSPVRNPNGSRAQKPADFSEASTFRAWWFLPLDSLMDKPRLFRQRLSNATLVRVDGASFGHDRRGWKKPRRRMGLFLIGRSICTAIAPRRCRTDHKWPIAVGLLLAQYSLKRTGKEAETLEAPAGSSIRDRPSIPAVEPAAIR